MSGQIVWFLSNEVVLLTFSHTLQGCSGGIFFFRKLVQAQACFVSMFLQHLHMVYSQTTLSDNK